ncbi:tetratricopeptide repeat protein [Thalassotalea profundi]|uniref:Sel1 repeat family protein n=1 Tax=Thalassotalea profundi TaxID=2036687 RepID=A0ABQ3IG35_9GAMM|nr:tetratricopeptide repeat protein [Thalassotalea profundi]GHE80011.1 hypothetical protein GCM10011501_04760 [Thalassotalea profundi]
MKKWIISSLLLSLALTSKASFAFDNNNQGIETAEEKLCVDDSCKAQILKLKKHSRYGNPETLILLASAYLTGEGVEKNPELAFKKIKRAVRSGSGKAMFILSAYYRDGIGTDKDIEKSNLWLSRSVKENYSQALYQTALLTLDFNKADNSDELDLLLRAEAKGNKDATYLLSILRETGTLVEKDALQAAKGYKRLAFSHYKDSQDRLVNLINSTEETSKEYSKIRALDEDIETITVTGEKLSFQMALSNAIERVTYNSLYDGKSTGSHIQGRGCTKKTNCRIYSDSNDISLTMNELSNANLISGN